MPYINSEKAHILGLDQIYKPDIDLLERLDFLQDAISIGKGQEIVGQIIYDLMDYAQDNLNLDEPCLQLWLFNEFEEYKIFHNEFKDKIEYYYFYLQMGVEIDAVEVASFLREWIES
jgi:hypothetical protein